MRPFDYAAGEKSDAVASTLDAGCRPYAGGTDLLPLLKSDIERVAKLVDVKTADLPRGIEETSQGVTLGALTTITEIAESRLLRARAALLGQAAALTATRQIRNRATVGGNLLQRPRCWYFRNPRTVCWLKGGEECLAVEGCNEQHAVYGASPCRAAHPSDLAGCLLALNAAVTLRGPGGSRRVSLDDFYAEPDERRRRETVIRDDELVVGVDVPLPERLRTVYLKAMDRKVWDFALAGIAATVRTRGGQIEDLRIVATGVATIPWRIEAVERHLRGTAAAAQAVTGAVDALDEGAAPLSGNAYKLDLLRRLLRRALDDLL